MWEQMPQEPTIAADNNKDKSSSKRDDGGLDV